MRFSVGFPIKVKVQCRVTDKIVSLMSGGLLNNLVFIRAASYKSLFVSVNHRVFIISSIIVVLNISSVSTNRQ